MSNKNPTSWDENETKKMVEELNKALASGYTIPVPPKNIPEYWAKSTNDLMKKIGNMDLGPDKEELLKAIQKMIIDETAQMSIDKLEVKPGDIILIKLNRPVNMLAVEKMVDILKSKFSDKIFKIEIFVVPDEMTISTMSEKEMSKAGWVKKDRYRLIRPEEKEE